MSTHSIFPNIVFTAGLYLGCCNPATAAVDHSTMDHAQHQNHQHGLGLHSYAPAGIMADHVHEKGEWMVSYRFMRMSMDGLIDGTDSVSSADALSMTGNYQYMMVPEDMTMDMHMLGLMYAVNDKVTVSAMIPYIDNSMSILRRIGTPISFDTTSSGIGDIKIGGLYLIKNSGSHQLHSNLVLSLPTGSIDEKANTPMGANTHLPFPMQLGSGTWDLLPGITYLGQGEGNLHWGAQSILTLRSGKNDNDYRLGNHLTADSWLAYVFTNVLSINTRLSYNAWGNINGDDSAQNPMIKNMNPNADPQLRGGKRLDLGFGIDLNKTMLNQHRLGLEVLFPIYQNLDGPQMETVLLTNFTYQYSF
ncbi:MAG: transporter [Planctomycetes bacterium]|nr:transporter [Planctomycetota bacterium]